MKAGDVLTSSSKDVDSDLNSIERTVEDERLSHALLNGEVTKEVMDMRYRDYKVSEASRDYRYNGDDRGVKVSSNREFDGRVKMIVENREICNGVYDELKRVDTKEYQNEMHTLNVEYSSAPKFKIENFCLYFKVSIGFSFDNEICLSFSSEPYFRKPITKAFINHMDSYASNILANGVFDEVKEMSFVTFGIETEKNYVKYTLKNLLCQGIEKIDGEYKVYYTFKDYEREDLTEKFKVDDLEKKYKAKEPKKMRSQVDFALDFYT